MRSRTRLAMLALTALGVAMTASPVAATAPTFETFIDGPFDDLVVDCGSYEIREVATFSARVTSYSDGTSRMQAVLDGSLYRTDDPATMLGTEHARTVRLIDGTVAQVTGNRWHIVISGEGMTAHDAGRLVLDFVTREVFSLSGRHPVLDGEFDFATLCEA